MAYINHKCRSVEDDHLATMPPPMKQSTFLVFESSLLLLFSSCIFCRHPLTSIKKILVGTFLRITQSCKKCLRTRVWESQPYIGKTPAGNILLSAAILFVGALPTRALRWFSVLNCPTISRNSFFRQQSRYLQPAIHSVWTTQQQVLLTRFINEQKPLVLAGDGRSDSPGHCAKYGSYSVIELSCSKVLDFKLVQVCIKRQFMKACNLSIYHHHFRVMRLEEVTTWKRRACIGSWNF